MNQRLYVYTPRLKFNRIDYVEYLCHENTWYSLHFLDFLGISNLFSCIKLYNYYQEFLICTHSKIYLIFYVFALNEKIKHIGILKLSRSMSKIMWRKLISESRIPRSTYFRCQKYMFPEKPRFGLQMTFKVMEKVKSKITTG